MKRKGVFTTENTESTEVESVASVRSVVNTEDLPDGFQMTELGPLPEEWRVVRLGEILIPVNREERKVVIEDDEEYVLLSISLYAQGVKVKEVVPGASLKTKIWYRVRKGDFLLLKIWARKGSYGFLQQDFPNAIVSGDYPILELQRHIADESFVEHFLSLPMNWQRLNAGAKGATNRQRVHEDQFIQLISIPLPPLPEQRAIARVLRTVQRAKEATEGVIAALRELKKSLMQHLFTYGPVPVTERERVPLQETEIGPLPAHWRVVRLGEVGKVITGKTPSTARPEYWNGHIPFITPVDLNGMPIRVAQRSITEDGLKKAKPLPKGAVLVSCIGYIGKVGVVDSEIAVTNQQINAVIVESSKISNWFLAYAVMRESNLLESRARKTTVPILHKTNFERIPIPLPPLSEQREIARILQAVDAKIAAEQARRTALEELFKSLLNALMSGQIRLPNIVGGQRSRDSAPNADPLPESED
jgi:type I restriction enzyme S subunit